MKQETQVRLTPLRLEENVFSATASDRHWYAACSTCNWQGENRYSYNDARDDASTHKINNENHDCGVLGPFG